ncbi:MAG: caspase family protein [Desmonostoc vinosum HA7617-LM4]|jgi:uncharacterized RDD family membrane protein YckC|nr:caspase family protein [Desmonostoc vinosum HA7617-LM4]
MGNFAIIIGINNYVNISKLNYAKEDAQKIHNFFLDELQLEKNNITLLVSDLNNDKYTPFGSNIKSGLKKLSEGKRFAVEDNLWFFFSGHGTYFEGLDYIMPLDGSMDDIQGTGVQVDKITESLKNTGAGNIIMILDACRDEGKRSGKGIGEQTIATAREKGIITFFSCSEGQSSYEIESLRGGAFTQALLEGMDRYATVAQLDEYIKTRVPQIGEENAKPLQNPRVIVNPPSKRNLILIEKNVKGDDIQTLKNNAYQTLYIHKDIASAEVLWGQILVLSGGRDKDALDAIVEIRSRKQSNQPDYGHSYSNSKTGFSRKNSSNNVQVNASKGIFGKRINAYLIDVFLVGILISLCTPPFKNNGSLSPVGGIIAFVIIWLYFALFESSSHEATPGKKILKIIVSDLQGNRISFLQATWRILVKICFTFLYILFGLGLLIDKLFASFHRDNHSLYETLTRTVVINKVQ